jgi:hypothetical protein
MIRCLLAIAGEISNRFAAAVKLRSSATRQKTLRLANVSTDQHHIRQATIVAVICAAADFSMRAICSTRSGFAFLLEIT